MIAQLKKIEADIIPDYEKKTLTVQLHHLANKSMDNEIKKMCIELNATETRFPRTNLQLILKVGSD